MPCGGFASPLPERLLLEYFGVTEDDLKSWGGSITNQGGDANADAIIGTRKRTKNS